jgi:hypothetical protein
MSAKLGSYDNPVREAELFRYVMAIDIANRQVAEDAKRGRDEGTCVLGAGVAIYVIPKGARNPRMRLLTQAPFQGNVGSFRASQRALAMIQDNLEGAFWYDGVMD